MPRREELQDERWKILKPLLPSPPVRTDGRGRPRCDDRAILNGICGFCAQGRDGKIDLNGFHYTRLVIGDSNAGLRMTHYPR